MRTFLVVAALMVAGTVMAQRNVSKYENTQARGVDPYARAYVRPLITNLEISGAPFKEKLPYSMDDVNALLQGQGNDLNIFYNNLRSRALYDLCERYDCDAIVAPTFHITGDNVNGFEVIVKGTPAKFGGWETATDADEKWIRLNNIQTTADIQNGGANAVLKNVR